MTREASKAIEIFYSYAREDELLRQELDKHLSSLKRQGFVFAWHDRDISAGINWKHEISTHLNTASIILLLISPDFMASDYCYGVEMAQAIKRHEIGNACVIPLFIRPTDWQGAPFSKLQCLPDNAIAVTSWLNQDEAFVNITEGIKKALKTLGPIQTGCSEPVSQGQFIREQISVDADNRNTEMKVHSKFINVPPLDVSDLFIGRIKQQKIILTQLKKKKCLVSIYGRAGVGKTALACKVLSNLQADQEDLPLEGTIYLSANNTDTLNKEISLERIFDNFLQILENNSSHLTETILHDPRISVKQKIMVLFNEIGNKHYILLLDNLEVLQNPETGELIETNLQTFLEITLEYSNTLHIIITSRIPLMLSDLAKTKEYPLRLEEGLSLKEAVQLLRQLDINNIAHLRRAPSKKLQVIAEKTRGFPRALIATVSFLMMDKLTSLDEILSSDIFVVDKVTEVLVQQAINRLTPNLIRIIEALALLGRQTKEEELTFLLSFYMDVTNLHNILNQLVNAYFIEYNKLTRKFSLHPIDREYCYNRIPEGSPADKPIPDTLPTYTQYALHHLAANYYERSRTPSIYWKNIDDLEPQLREFEHRLKAEDYDNAARLIDDIDTQYLSLWGHARQVLNMREVLLGKIKEYSLQGKNLSYLGRAYCNIGQFRKAIDYSEKALLISRELGDQRLQATNLVVLGECYRVGGEYMRAVQYFGESITFADKLEDNYNKLEALCFLGMAHRNMGNYEMSVQCHLQAQIVAQKSNDMPGESHNLLSLGVTYYEMGQIEQGIDCYQKALNIVRKTNDKDRESDILGNLGIAFRASGEHKKAVEYFQQALEVALNFHRRWECIWLGNLGVVYELLGEFDRAVKYQKESLAIARELEELRSIGFALARLGKTYLVMDKRDDALGTLLQSFEIAKQIQNPRDQQCWGTVYAECLLHQGFLNESFKVTEHIRKYNIPENNHNAALVDGLININLQRYEDAFIAFNQTLSHSDILLIKTPHFYEAKYTRSLALLALALLVEDEQKAAFFTQARDAYHNAYLNCHSLGVIKEALYRLDCLQSLDENGILTQIKDIFQNI